MKNLFNYCTEDMQAGSVLAMEKGTPLIKLMPYAQVRGNAYSYNIINNLIPTEHREVGTDVDAYILEPVKKTVLLKVLTNRAKVDRAMGIMSDITDLLAEQQELGMISLGKALERHCLEELQTYATNGDAGKVFTGALSIDLLDDALDFVTLGANAIFVNNNSHRALKKLLKAEGQELETIESFGKRVIAYNGIPVFVSHDLADGIIIIARVGEDAVHGITNAGLQTYTQDAGVMQITDTELIHNVVVKTTDSFAVIKPATKSK